ncbi:isocitrate lyase/PEP mutase family protein [Labrys wisconsinensis]|uniref:Methylisocitrate lyase n=1 Tax=Labrys wisconsinensis TaxID=425677 RepID=A0ABU0J459_9HYPH|nr:isocitrate lyase/phosphoenolpyruvate mutase family protein [Labrys wisconsinensis]MDQ0468405.1 methylisocitrate lyase [Labrys wisconsinensis]
MRDQEGKAATFRSLHRRAEPFVLFNIWDAGSAKAVGEAGASALATGSWSVAAANGFADGEKVPISLVLDNARRIVEATGLPVSLDIESGYGVSSEEVAGTIARVAATGVIGCNLEDSFPADGSMRPLAMQAERIAAARRAADAKCPGFFINARTDIFFQVAAHDEAMADTAIERARAYADAGADGIFVPGLVDEALIARVCAAVPLPINVMVGERSPSLERLATAGVARVSHGPGPYLAAMAALRAAASHALAGAP